MDTMSMTARSMHGGGPPSTRKIRVRKILLVDPDLDRASGVADALEALGYYLNRVTVAAEGRRRAAERVYDLVVLGADLGEGVLPVIVDELGGRASPPPVLVLAGPDGLKRRADLDGVTCVMVLRGPISPGDAVEAVRTLIGGPWEERKPKG
jgi:DNA-binding response OmpR family regulator